MRISSSIKATRYVLIDFSCSKSFTHNWTYLLEFGNFISRRDTAASVEYWINRAADERLGSNAGAPVHPFLLSPIYGYSKSKNFRKWLIDRFFERGLNLLNRDIKLRLLRGLFLRMATNYYTQAPLRFLKVRAKESEQLVLVFPSIDGLGLHFLERCLSEKIPISKIVIRTLQAETRGMFSVPNLSAFVENLILRWPGLDVRIGYEVERVGEKLRMSSKTNTRILWSPIPSSKEMISRKLQKSGPTKKIGFLGAARRLKGFEHLPRIIRETISSGSSFEFYVQLAAEEWEGYREILNDILEIGAQITFLEGGCSDELLLKTISELDCLVLPYFVDEYKFAGSGLLFHAADFGVPVISMHGVGFDWDIKHFSVGVLCYSFKEISHQIRDLDDKDYKNSITKYNFTRNEITTKLLGLEN